MEDDPQCNTFSTKTYIPQRCVLLIKPDFLENKEDWPFLWGENEYVVALAPSYIYAVNAANDLLNPIGKRGLK